MANTDIKSDHAIWDRTAMHALRMDTENWTVFYHPALAMDNALLPAKTCGKWMCFFVEEERESLEAVCHEAIETESCFEAKMSTPVQMAWHGTEEGVVCFYIDGAKEEQHVRLLTYMLSKHLFPYDEEGNLRNADFKFDWQTSAGMYDEQSGYVPQIVLSDFVDLKTGNFR